MTVSSETARMEHAGNDVTTEFTISFYFLADADISAVLSVDATGVESALVLTTDYTLAGAANPAGGTLTMLTAPATGETLTIIRDVAATQGTDYVENTSFPAESHETALDRLTMLIQKLQEQVNRSLVQPVSQQNLLTVPVPIATYYLRYNADGDDLEAVDIADLDLYTVSAFSATLLDDANAAAWLTTLGLDNDLLTISLPANTTISAFVKTLLDDVDAAAFQTTLGVRVGTDIPAQGDSLQNLIANSGHGVRSNSGLDQGRTVGQQSNAYDVGSAILDNDGSAIGDWNGDTTRCTVSVAGGEFTMTDDGTGTTMLAAVDMAGLTVGKSYKLSIQLENGTGTWVNELNQNIRILNNAQTVDLAVLGSQTEAGGMIDYSVIWEATETNNVIVLKANVAAAQTVKFDNVYVVEVIAGEPSGTTAADGHSKTTTLESYKFYNADNTYGYGQFLSKLVAGAASSEFYNYDGLVGINYKDLQGQPVAFGCLVYSVSADDNIKISIHAGVSQIVESSTFVAANTLTWVEVTGTVPANATKVQARIIASGDSTDVAYISHPILVKGSSIGEGNYLPAPNETINMEVPFALSQYNATAKTTAADIPINFEGQSSVKLPKNLKALHIQIKVRDSGSGGAAAQFGIGADVSVFEEMRINIGTSGLTLANDDLYSFNGRVNTNTLGDIEAEITASGSLTLDATINVLAVELK